jgi:uncharacterized membrane protein YkvA (DUF1232 family)
MLHLIEVTVIVGGVLSLAFMLLLSLPQCKLRDMLMPFVAWGFVALCAAYAISPVDFVPELVCGPFGMADDFIVAVAGVGTAMARIRAKKQKHSARNDPYFNN